MNDDAKEAALSLLSLAPASVPIIPLKRKQSATTLPSPQDDVSSEAINCICGLTYDDGFSIACDKCSRWCHAACFDIVEGGVPEEWQCWECKPRDVDRERAFKLQKARQKQVEDLKELEKAKRRQSPGIDRKHRRTSAPAVDGTNSKRKRRPSMVQPNASHHHHHHHHSNGHNNEDEHVDIDEPWTHSYIPIAQDIIPSSDTRDKLRRQAQHWRGITALSPSSPNPMAAVYLPPNHPAPPTSVQPLPSSSYNHPALSLYTNHSVRPPSYSVHTTTPIQSKQYIAPFVSTITPTSSYLADPLNAYAHLGMPKPFVHLMGPPLDVALDARLTGGKSRFVRSGCRPNAVLRPILCSKPSTSTETSPVSSSSSTQQDSESLTFGVFALRDLKANEEIVLGWEWDDGNAVHSLPALIESPHMFPPEQIRHLRAQMANILHALASAFATCACGSKSKDCVITQIAAFVDGEVPSGVSRPVDLGPLIGTKRGFKTRERVPFSGGMTGVEMCEDSNDEVGDSTTETEKQVLGHGRFGVKARTKDRRRRKGDENGKDDVVQDASRNYINSSSAHCPPRHRPPDPTPSDDTMDVDLSIEEAEAKMPPKLRKRWIQRESEALKELNGRNSRNSQSPGTSTTNAPSGTSSTEQGERVKGAAGLNGGSGLGIRVEDDDKTDTDDGVSTLNMHHTLPHRMPYPADRDHDMPPPSIPPMPSPPAVSSSVISRRGGKDPPQPVIQISRPHSPSPSPQSQREQIPTSLPLPPPSASPSVPFANLSLLSPVIPSTVALSEDGGRGFRKVLSEEGLKKLKGLHRQESPSRPPPATQPNTSDAVPAGGPPPITSSPSEPSSALSENEYVHSPPSLSSSIELEPPPPPSSTESSTPAPSPEAAVATSAANPSASSPSPAELSAPPLPDVDAVSASHEEPMSSSISSTPQEVPMEVDQEPDAHPSIPSPPPSLSPVAKTESLPPHEASSGDQESSGLPAETRTSASVSPIIPTTPAPISIASLMNPSSTPSSPIVPPPSLESGSSSIPAPPKVKMSLKDFALRRKKQKEEEEREKEQREKEEKDRMEKEAQERKEREREQREAREQEEKDRAKEEARTKIEVESVAEAVADPDDVVSMGSAANDSIELEIPLIKRLSSPPPIIGNDIRYPIGTHINANYATNRPNVNGSPHSPLTRQAKVEMLDTQVPPLSAPRQEPVFGRRTPDARRPFSASHVPLASPQGLPRHHVRRPSREDGEIPSTGDESPRDRDRDDYFQPAPPLSASSSSSTSFNADHHSHSSSSAPQHSNHHPHSHTSHNSNHYNHHPPLVQSHSPPTQPRSFLSPRNTTPSPSTSGTPSSAPPRRPSLPPLRAGLPTSSNNTGNTASSTPAPLLPTNTLARPPPRGPRALYNGGGASSGMSNPGPNGGMSNGGSNGSYSSYPPPRPYGPPPRRPLADRDRPDRDRRPGPLPPRSSTSRGVGWSR
ncbi:hypothetical protein AX16_008504 [Volvariella volvacea WC 439]|nr:hypothetical protein AX16_008504 [Volvariella volvacea WC 439]